ncbi:MAG: nitroreductase family protein [Synergistaceae bacterium]|nr:nitroreductase family protein [Synergistaceae bacterium]
MKSLIVNESKCTKCGLCAEVCPSKILCFGESGFPEMAKGCSESCIECGQCVVFCPASANSLSFMDADKLIRAADLSMPEPEAALNLLKTRRSIRKFQNKTVSSDVLEKIFGAVRMAPTACNDQTVRWIVSGSPENTKEIVDIMHKWLREEIFKDPMSELGRFGAAILARARAGDDILLRGAPHVAVAVVPKNYKWPEDGSIALTYFELAAHALGVGACWAGFLTMAVRSYEELRKYLGISEDEYMCGGQMFGYPALKPTRQFPPRRKMDIVKL